MLSCFKFIINSLPALIPSLSPEFLQQFFKQLFYVTFYYGLSFETKQVQITFMHSGLLHNQLLNYKEYKTLLSRILEQPKHLRRLIRNCALKITKIVADRDFEIVIGVLQAILEQKEFSHIIHINALDIIRHLVRYHDDRLQRHLYRIIVTILKSLDPHKPELRVQCQDCVTWTLRSILHRYPCTSFHQKKQHFYVVSGQNQISIFNLKMAME